MTRTRKALSIGILVLVAAGAVLLPVAAQQARYSVAGGDVSCTTTPSLYRNGDPGGDTGYGISANGTCTTINGTTHEATSATVKTLTGIDLRLATNNKYFQGTSSGGASYDLIGVNASNQVALSRTSVDVVPGGGNNNNDFGVSGNAWKTGFFATSVNVAGVNVTTPVGGVAGGYRIARVSQALDGSNPTSWTHGLTTAVACNVTLVGTAAPGVGTSVITHNINGAAIDIYAWKVTASGDATLIASTGTETVQGVCVGT